MSLFPALLAIAPVASTSAPPPATTEPWLALDPAAPSLLAPALAEGSKSAFSYTFIEAGAIQYDVDQIDDDTDIFYGRGSLSLFDFLHLIGEYQNQSTDFENTDTDLIKLGAGVHFGLTPSLDVLAELTYNYSDISSDLDELDDTFDAFEVFAGARWMLLPWDGGGLEVNGGARMIDTDNPIAEDDQLWGWEAGARVHFLEMLSVGATYAILEDDDYFAANVRFSF